MISERSARTLVAAVKALGGCPDRRDRELVREALLRARADLADEFARAFQGNGPEAYAAFGRMCVVVEAAGGSRYSLLDLVTTEESRVGPCERRVRSWQETHRAGQTQAR